MPTELRQTLIAPHEPITHLFFPETGYASVIADPSDGRIEVGIIGREGLVGVAPVLLDSGTSPYHEVVQCPGEVLVIDAASFCAAVDWPAS
jgi:CRP-like cAMP-binding protein